MRTATLLAASLALGAPGALAQSFDVVPSPNRSPGDSATFNILRGVGASSSTNAWAVGDWYEPAPGPYQTGQTRTLAMRWDGASWSIVPTPDPIDGGNALWDVEVISEDLAWAAGNKGGNGARPLMLRWNGSAWSEHSLPLLGDPPGGTGVLLATHAVGPDDIWAVGTAGNWGIMNPGYSSFVPLTFHWDGSSWEISVPPFVGDFRHTLEAVDASAPDNVWAVGAWGNSYGEFRPLVYRFDGQAWNAMPAPFGGNPGMPLHSVAVVGPDDVWVTADRITTGSGPVTAHWDGSAWTEHANPGGTGAVLAVGPNEIYGFGSTITRWDGSSWSVVDDLSDAPGAALHSAALTAGGAAWAVGRVIPADEIQTLTVRGQGLGEVTTGTEPATGGGEPLLSAPRPNPARREAAVTLTLARPSATTVHVFDGLGRRVLTLIEGSLAAGTHRLRIDAGGLAPGLYVVRAEAGERSAAMPLMIAR